MYKTLRIACRHSKFLLFSKYIQQKLQVFNLMGRIRSFGFSAQIDRKNWKLQGKGSQQKGRCYQKRENTSNQYFFD